MSCQSQLLYHISLLWLACPSVPKQGNISGDMEPWDNPKHASSFPYIIKTNKSGDKVDLLCTALRGTQPTYSSTDTQGRDRVLSIGNPSQVNFQQNRPAQDQETAVEMSEQQHPRSHDHSHDHDHAHSGPAHLFQATSSGDQPPDDWKESGVRVIPAGSLDTNTPQTPGMSRAAAITNARVGAQKLWAGTVKIHPNAKTGAHHHGHLESVIYVVKGKARMRWGDKLQFTAEAGPGDFIYVPPWVPHQEINANEDEELECVLMRSDDSAVAVNIPDLVPVEDPESVKWVDPTHPTGGV